MRSQVTRRLLAVAVVVAAVGVQTLPVFAAPVTLFTASDFFIPRPASATDQEGLERQIASVDLAAAGHADLIGLSCAFTVQADNGDSVNENNYAVIRTGTEETEVYQTESVPNVTNTVLADGTLTVGPTITMFNVMLPGAGDIVGTSVDFTIIVDCAVPSSTTSSSTTSSSTTPAPAPTSTTTAPDPSTTTTAQATTSTDDPGPTTPDESSTTIPPTVEATLPFTGSNGETGLVLAAVALLTLGSAGVLAARPRGRHSR